MALYIHGKKFPGFNNVNTSDVHLWDNADGSLPADLGSASNPVLTGSFDVALLLNESMMTSSGVELFRIIALEDRLGGRVKKGTKGGWAVSPDSVRDQAWLEGNSRIASSKACVSGSACVSGNSSLRGNALVSGEARVVDTVMTGDSVVSSRAVVRGTHLSKNAQVHGMASVFGSILSGTVCITDHADVSDSTLTGSITVQGNSMLFNCRVKHPRVFRDTETHRDVKEF